jgi:hypothetical protein
MATIRIEKKTGARRLTLTWQPGEYDSAEEIIKEFPKSRQACNFIMRAVLVAKAAEQTGLLPPTHPDSGKQQRTGPPVDITADALKKFKL